MDPMERLIAADPLPEAERLTDADQAEADALLARILAEQPERARRAPRRRWVPAIAATAAAVALALVAIDVVDEDASGPGIIDRAVAAVSDPNAIYHTVEVLRLRGVDSDAPHRAWSSYTESWYGPNHATRQLGYTFRHGHRGRLLSEQVTRFWPRRDGRFRGRGAMYDPVHNRITHVGVGRLSNDRIPFFDPNGDPAAGLRKLQREGRLQLAGSERLDGHRVYRLTSTPFRWCEGLNRINYLVDARTYYPVFVRWVSQGRDHRIVSETRYLTYERLPFDPEHRKLLKMDPHPGAKVFGLPRYWRR